MALLAAAAAAAAMVAGTAGGREKQVYKPPPMGWSSWNPFAGAINEAVITNVTTQWTPNIPLIYP